MREPGLIEPWLIFIADPTTLTFEKDQVADFVIPLQRKTICVTKTSCSSPRHPTHFYLDVTNSLGILMLIV